MSKFKCNIDNINFWSWLNLHCEVKLIQIQPFFKSSPKLWQTCNVKIGFHFKVEKDVKTVRAVFRQAVSLKTLTKNSKRLGGRSRWIFTIKYCWLHTELNREHTIWYTHAFENKLVSNKHSPCPCVFFSQKKIVFFYFLWDELAKLN